MITNQSAKCESIETPYPPHPHPLGWRLWYPQIQTIPYIHTPHTTH